MIRDKLNTALAKAFDTKLSDAVKPFTGTKYGEASYDPATGTMTPAETPFQGRGVFSGYRSYEIGEGFIEPQDIKLIALASEVTAMPEVDDTIDGYRVLDVRLDPTETVLTIQLRKSHG